MEPELNIDESKKVLDLLGETATKLNNVDWKKLSAELTDLNDAEKKELITIAAKKLLAGLLVLISA